MIQIKKTVLSLFLSGIFLSLFSQKEQVSYEVRDISSYEVNTNKPADILTSNHRLVKIDIQKLQNIVKTVDFEINNLSKGTTISFPHPDGTNHTYKLVRNTTMHPDLAAKYPLISTYNAYGVSNPEENGKIDVTPSGLHVMMKSSKQSTFYVDPYNSETTEDYIIYKKADIDEVKDFTCQVEDGFQSNLEKKSALVGFGTCELRKYRLALSATAEYTAFQGGSVAQALAAQVTTMNRVNGIYEETLAMTFEIVANNDKIIYTNAATDPFTNGNAGAMITQNVTACNTEIGSANYDIGHVFGTNSGGLAAQGVCYSNKAQGVTGSGSPRGDAFDVDYVAHEMGHQFGASHTFNNSCGGNRMTPSVEPGSGSTIMAYAGICAPDVQGNSDDYFHGISMEEIADHITSTTCAAKTTLVNNIPVITSTTTTNTTVPSGTPFTLRATATDADAADELYYLWEQIDNRTSTQPPVNTSTRGPNFRSYTPSVESTRYIPKLSELRKGEGRQPWEVLPIVARNFDFRLVVKDNHSLGSCNDHKNIRVNVDASTGPFLVTYPTTTGITWLQNTDETVLWDVAGTDGTPINCSSVDIFLSTDNGLTYPEVLATNVPNTGSYVLPVPNIPTTSARIMVMCSDGNFFNVSYKRFTISSQVSVEENQSNNFKLYPNPASESLNLFLNEVKKTEINIFDIAGKLVYSNLINTQNTSINIENFKTGMYFVHVKNDSTNKTVKIIKE